MGYLVSLQTDGLGVRLGTLSSVMALASKTELDWFFLWPSSRNRFHGIPKSGEIFDPNFLNHQILEPPPEWSWIHEVDFCRENLGQVSSEKFGNLGSYPIRVGLNLATTTQRSLGISIDDLRTGWAAIGFSDYAREVQGRAAEWAGTRRSAPAAIHMRSGDILHGSWRNFSYHWKKVITVPVALAIADFLHESSGLSREDIQVFPQDLDAIGVLDYLGFDSILPTATIGEPENFESSFYDLCRLAHSDSIVSGVSGFTVAASRAGRAQLSYFHDLLPKDVLARESLAYVLGAFAGSALSQTRYVSNVLLVELGDFIEPAQVRRVRAKMAEVGLLGDPGVLLSLGVFSHQNHMESFFIDILRSQDVRESGGDVGLMELLSRLQDWEPYKSYYGRKRLTELTATVYRNQRRQ